MKKNNTKRSLGLSILSLVLCFTMLMGTTYAWFTDSVTSASNIIASGNLDVDVYFGDPEDEKSVQSVDTLFSDVALWEPGAVAYENLTVVNKGSLALKYQMTLAFTDENYILENGVETFGLSDILKVGLVDGGLADGLTREEALAEVDQWIPVTDITLSNSLEAYTNEDTFAMVIYWEPSAEDNDYNVQNGKVTSDGEPLHISFGITLLATQATVEDDAFNNQYDKEATFPQITSGTLDENTMNELSLTVDPVTVKVPATAPYGEYALVLTHYEAEEDATTGKTQVDVSFELQKDGQAVDPDAAEYDVVIQVEYMADIHELTHYDDEITDFVYDVYTGTISFKTRSFSPFGVDYTVFGKEVEFEQQEDGSYRFTRGFFRGVNPALGSEEFGLPADPSLLGETSEYIAVDCVKDGVKCYAVSKRSTTVILGDADDGGQGYTFENGNYPVKMINNNRLYAEISALQNNEHSTVYILPGTYKEATTVYIYSSMDIVGLGDAADIEVIKQSSSNSNRHLFNATGEKADYIHVTIRNMKLDATANTTGGKDNAAVQSIRKSKVKCYDLDIIKNASSMSSIALYVNGNNAVNGVKYPAYLYVENCTLNSKNSFSVISTAGTYKFYHTGLTYGGTKYAKNGGSIRNYELPWNNWEWTIE